MVAAICLVGINAIFKWLRSRAVLQNWSVLVSSKARLAEQFLPRSSVSWAGHDRVDRAVWSGPASLAGWVLGIGASSVTCSGRRLLRDVVPGEQVSSAG